MELMVTFAGIAAPLRVTMMPDKCTAMGDSTMAAGWEDTVHGHMKAHMVSAQQFARLPAIMMQEKCGVIMVWMRMDARWVTIAQLLVATQLQPLVPRPLVLQPLVLQAQPPRENY